MIAFETVEARRQDRGTRQRGDGQEEALVLADDEARDVRADEADEADRADEGDGDRRKQRDEREDFEPQPVRP